MVKLTVAVTVRVVQAIVDDPKLSSAGIDVEATNQTDAANDTVFVATILPPNQLNGLAKAFVQHGIIKQQIPDASGTISGLTFSHNSREVGLAAQQILAVVELGERHGGSCLIHSY